jgi:hypothetical protein
MPKDAHHHTPIQQRTETALLSRCLEVPCDQASFGTLFATKLLIHQLPESCTRGDIFFVRHANERIIWLIDIVFEIILGEGVGGVYFLVGFAQFVELFFGEDNFSWEFDVSWFIPPLWSRQYILACAFASNWEGYTVIYIVAAHSVCKTVWTSTSVTC